MTNTPATRFYLTINSDKVVVEFDGTKGGRISRPVLSAADFDAFLTSKANEAGVTVDDLSVMISSTLHFPDEWTKNPETIALARELGA